MKKWNAHVEAYTGNLKYSTHLYMAGVPTKDVYVVPPRTNRADQFIDIDIPGILTDLYIFELGFHTFSCML